MLKDLHLRDRTPSNCFRRCNVLSKSFLPPTDNFLDSKKYVVIGLNFFWQALACHVTDTVFPTQSVHFIKSEIDKQALKQNSAILP